ncbi:Dynamin- GTPase protein, variant 2 [Puccinia graminis f. sp. tritici]|uniref:Dynamin-GTPase protein, variant 2 n=1 Tax=Puccinia graminis f. sp. tritici TaxID=56615 RepID=A0A5B0P2E8_PUCGR|nr:Dynamin- GTPase protein, variant 2 [Puccinia graminis f. sp. tritici]KAA1128947.1 Dynamin- GTPase protein, variant 2 [Puccinia graminis f. sp. tritici]
MDGDLITLVNKLQDTFNAIGGETVDLPQIVVVGSQSSGKSSVLETIVGRDFLPRGSGIVTRRPLVLQLIHLPSTSPSESSSSLSGPEYGEFLHLPNRRFTEFEEIRKEIENETLRVAGSNNGISRLPINVKIHSPRVLNLTLVDLPGLTKLPVGDQPTDIERQIRNLVLEYISKPNSVILAVSPANVDLANSDSLKLARSVDPQGRRTIGVLTKLDLMDTGTNALDILTGRVYPLKLGFTGIVNRSQHDINMKLPMEQALAKEDEFFRSHPAYRNIAHRCGTKFLAKTLNQVLMSHIRDKLPDMKARLNTLMGQTQQELNAFGGDSAFWGKQNRGSLVLKLMTQFVKDFVSSIDGSQANLSTKELCGGARIHYIFNEVFGQALQTLNPMENLNNMDIRTSIRNSTGTRSSLFIPEAAFDLLIKPQIKLLEPPGLRCVELVYEELMKICHNCTNSELQRYPRLHAQLIEAVSELLRERLGPTSEYVQSLIDIQAAYINTNHPDFMKNTTMNGGSQYPHGSHVHVNGSSDQRRSVSDGDVEDSSSANEDEDGTSQRSAAFQNQRQVPTLNGQVFRPSSAPIDQLQSGSHLAGAVNPKRIASDNRHSGPPNPPLSHYHRDHHHSTSLQYGSAKDSFLNYFFGGTTNGVGNAMLTQPTHRSRHKTVTHDSGENSSSQLIEGSHSLQVGHKTPGFEGAHAAFNMKSLDKHFPVTTAGDDQKEVHLSEREQMEINLIRSLMMSYFSIVRQTIQDLVPKAVMHLLVNHVREGVQNRLVSSLYREELFEGLLMEDEGLRTERERVKALLDAYKDAFKTLSEVFPDDKEDQPMLRDQYKMRIQNGPVKPKTQSRLP